MRMTYWTLFGVFQLLLGLVLHFTNIIPMNTGIVEHTVIDFVVPFSTYIPGKSIRLPTLL